jgi:hypothetical protein
VERAAGEALAVGDGREHGAVQLAGGQHDRIGVVGQAVARGLDRPDGAGVVPPARGDLGVGHDEPVDAVLARDRPQVAQDLVLGRAQARPVAPLGVGQGVQVAGHVARRARVGVVAPRAPEPVAALEHDDVLDPVPAQLDRRDEAAEAGSDDDHART